MPPFMQEILDASVFPACADIARKDGIPSGKFFDTCSICLGPSRLESTKKKFSNNRSWDEYLSRLGNMFLDGGVFCKEGNHNIGIKQIFTIHSGLPSRSCHL